MKKLQNDFTTPEQSKRLLELGVPESSANYCYECSLIGGEKYYARELLDDTTFSKYKRAYDSSCVDIIPCWSVGRLIEIYITCIKHYTGDERLTFGQDTVRLGMIDCIIAAIEVGCNDGDIDFSKLED